ncbi:hypothetical protein LV779_35115 [Streptomyces thinghirensis]|nr:hypothetical protein [Streptomyces thinghirensis]
MPTPSAPSTSAEAPPLEQRSILLDLAFLRLWTGATASGLATWALPFVLGLAVFERTLTATDLGLLLAARTVGFLAAVPVAGVPADRHSRRGVVLWAGLAAGASAPVIAVGLDRSVLLMAAAAAGRSRPGRLPTRLPGPDRRGGRRRPQAAGQRRHDPGGTGHHARGTPHWPRCSPSSWTPGHCWWASDCSGSSRPAFPDAAHGRGPPKTRRSHRPRRAGHPFLAEFTEGVREARRHPWFLAGLGALTAVIATGYPRPASPSPWSAATNTAPRSSSRAR